MKTDFPVLRRLGPVPFWRGEKRCLDELNRIYTRASAAAQEALGSTASGAPAKAPPATRRRGIVV